MDADTLSRMFWQRVETSGARDAHLVKRGGRWHGLTWDAVGQAVRELSLGLIAIGRRRGDAVALLSSSRSEWVQADFAILTAGCVTIPIYPTYTSDQIAHIVNDAEARTLVVETRALLAGVLEVRAKFPGLEQIVVIEDAGQHDPSILSWDHLRQLGREGGAMLEASLADRMASTRPDDIATIVYTSGTTGTPKGVVQTHANHIAALAAVARIPGVQTGDIHLLFLPLAHTFARMEAFMAVHRQLVTAFAESLHTVAANLREVHPHFIFGVPRVFDKVHARVLHDLEQRSFLVRGVFAWAMRVGREVSRLQQAGRPVPRRLAVKRRLAHRMAFAKLHEAFGGNLRFAVSGGAPLSRDVAEFFHAAGILILEGYGLTETCPVLTFNRIDCFKFGSVGQAIPGVELRTAEDGEILARGPNIATRGYWKQPAATVEAFGADGWLRTGDVGRIDDDGFLHVSDRKKDLIITSGGVNIAPQHLEALLTRDRMINQALIHGDRRPYPVALVTLNPDAVAAFAVAHGIPGSDHAERVRHPMVLNRIAEVVERANVDLPAYARIKRFAVLPEEFTEEGGQLTATQKVKRRLVTDQYQDIIASLY